MWIGSYGRVRVCITWIIASRLLYTWPAMRILVVAVHVVCVASFSVALPQRVAIPAMQRIPHPILGTPLVDPSTNMFADQLLPHFQKVLNVGTMLFNRLRNAMLSLVAFLSTRLKVAPYTTSAVLAGIGYLVVASTVRRRRARATVKEEEEDLKTTDPSAVLDFGAALFGAALDLTASTASAAYDAASSMLVPSAGNALDSACGIGNDEDDDREEGGSSAGSESEEGEQSDGDAPPFIPSAKFVGQKEGYVFKSGPRAWEGAGYYNRNYEWK